MDQCTGVSMDPKNKCANTGVVCQAALCEECGRCFSGESPGPGLEDFTEGIRAMLANYWFRYTFEIKNKENIVSKKN